ncbi:MAG: hypothetical protein Q8910_00965 [Bacteroidota bacterium]|nr:hypothetical protein [Bacteroidota bacterium]
MIFLGNLVPVSPTQSIVHLMSFNPLDPIDGMKKENGNVYTQAELESIGFFVDSIPPENPSSGKVKNNMYINPETKEITYDYVDAVKTQEQIMADLQAQNAQMLLALVTGGLM